MKIDRQLLILLSLYIAQGLPFGFFTQAMPAIMRDSGVDLKYIGLMSLLALPWALKFLWAPLLDRYPFMGLPLRKGWILLANALAVLSIFIFSLESVEWWLNGGIVFTLLILLSLNVFAASQDISTDALAIETVPADKRGWINGIQVSGYRIGMVIGGGLILAWLPLFGWQYAMYLMAGILLLTSLPILFASNENLLVKSPNEHDQQEVKTVGRETVFESWRGLFNRKGIWIWVGLLLTYKAGDAFGTAMLKPMMVDAGFGLTDLALIMGTYGVIAGLVGAIVGAVLIKPLGRMNALIIFAGLQSFSLALYGLYSLGTYSTDVLIGICMLEHVTGAMATIGIFTIMMDYCRSTHAGLDYSFQSCLIIVSGLIVGSLSGFSASELGYAVHFLMASGLTVLGLLWVLWQRKAITAVSAV